ncbi:nucleotidyltransferase family protein [Paenibacillus sp. 32O-W]|uniref:nucleotidyltransferase family protein n=1 Tax=Paenibacillus sp. 32O-W TaxID=1695218 RepID=UPI000781EDFB|nr:nucleotidyltransferase family protein [Paenibacillus sp. 32O-W]
MQKHRVEEILKRHKQELAKKYHVQKIGLFGSYARDEHHEHSDVDILVSFDRPVGLKFIELKNDLETLLECEVDLVTEAALKPAMREEVLREVQYQ